MTIQGCGRPWLEGRKGSKDVAERSWPALLTFAARGLKSPLMRGMESTTHTSLAIAFRSPAWRCTRPGLHRPAYALEKTGHPVHLRPECWNPMGAVAPPLANSLASDTSASWMGADAAALAWPGPGSVRGAPNRRAHEWRPRRARPPALTSQLNPGQAGPVQDIRHARIEEAERLLSMAAKAAVDTNDSGINDARNVARWESRGHVVLLVLSIPVAVLLVLAFAKFPLIPTLIATAAALLFGTAWGICRVKQKNASTSELSNFRESAGWDNWTGNMRFYIAV
jgi:hypothetical protein